MDNLLSLNSLGKERDKRTLTDVLGLKHALASLEKDRKRTESDAARLKADREKLLGDIASIRAYIRDLEKDGYAGPLKDTAEERLRKAKEKLNAIDGITPPENPSKDYQKIVAIVNAWEQAERDLKSARIAKKQADRMLEIDPRNVHTLGVANRAEAAIFAAKEAAARAAGQARFIKENNEYHPARDESIGNIGTAPRELPEVVSMSTSTPAEDEWIFYTHERSVADHEERVKKIEERKREILARQAELTEKVIQGDTPSIIEHNELVKETAALTEEHKQIEVIKLLSSPYSESIALLEEGDKPLVIPKKAEQEQPTTPLEENVAGVSPLVPVNPLIDEKNELLSTKETSLEYVETPAVEKIVVPTAERVIPTQPLPIQESPPGEKVIPQEIVPGNKDALAQAETATQTVIQRDLDKLFGSRGFLGIGKVMGSDSKHWKDPTTGFEKRAVDEVMSLKTEALEALKGRRFGIENEGATLKMQAYIENVSSRCNVTPLPGEEVGAFLARAILMKLSRPPSQ